MERNTNLKRLTNKKGSYIVEAAITLPIFLISMVVMSSIILFYSCIENANFITAMTLRKGAAEAIALEHQPLLPAQIMDDIQDQHSMVQSERLTDYGYRVSRGGFDELIPIQVELRMHQSNPLRLASDVTYELSLVTRAYVGKERNQNPMSVSEFMDDDASPVYIFPKDGERYHAKNCTFVKAASQSAPLTRSIQSKYGACEICHSDHASIGTIVYIFPSYGEDYHFSTCSALQRNFIEVEKGTAVERGYTPCSKCGGGS